MEWTFTTNVDTEALVESLCENRDFMREVAGHLSTYDVANELSISDIAYEIDTDDLAREIAINIDLDEIAGYIGVDGLAREFDHDILCKKILDLMPDRIEDPRANDERYTELQAQVTALTQTVERLCGLFDWGFQHMRRGVVLIDANVQPQFGTGVFERDNNTFTVTGL